MEEFKIKVDKEKKLKSQIELKAHYLSEEGLPYDVLCWELAEFQLIAEKGRGNYTENDNIRRAKGIFDSSLKYPEICWLISEYKIYLEQKGLYP